MSEVDMSLDEHLQQIVLPLIAITEDAKWHPVGTAFVITTFTPNSALLITAAHNLHHLVRLDTPTSPRAANMPTDFLPPPPKSIQIRKTYFYAGVEGPREFVLAEVIRSWYQNDTDIAIVLAVLPKGSPAEFTARFALDPSPVAAGTVLTAIGYGAMAAEFASPPDYERQDFRIQFTKSIVKRPGPVTAVHPRGVGMYKWPGFIVGCALDSGMSGGPLVDLSREVPIVRGIACGDLSQDEDSRAGSGTHAFGSFLWPALGTPLELSVHLTSAGEEVWVDRLIDLVRHNVLDDRGESLVHFRCMGNETGHTVAWI